MSAARHAIALAVAASAALLALKGARHADEARAVIGPAARAAFEDAHKADVPADEAVAAAQAWSEARKEKPGTD